MQKSCFAAHKKYDAMTDISVWNDWWNKMSRNYFNPILQTQIQPQYSLHQNLNSQYISKLYQLCQSWINHGDSTSTVISQINIEKDAY